ncbi:MAG: hypothetical protein AAF938_27140, partial [Myxococcota bacterium]
AQADTLLCPVAPVACNAPSAPQTPPPAALETPGVAPAVERALSDDVRASLSEGPAFDADTVSCTLWPSTHQLRIVARDFADDEATRPVSDPNRQLVLSIANVREPGAQPVEAYDGGRSSLNYMAQEPFRCFQRSGDATLTIDALSDRVRGTIDALAFEQEGGDGRMSASNIAFECALTRR